MRSLRRTLVAAVLGLCLSASGALAGSGLESPRAPEIAASWSLSQLGISLRLLLAGFWAKAGCHIDPDGRCAPQPIASDIGCHIDPDGHCAPRPIPSKAGCNIDPSGHCAPQPVQAKEGCHIDPNGRCLR